MYLLYSIMYKKTAVVKLNSLFLRKNYVKNLTKYSLLFQAAAVVKAKNMCAL